jgi:hypothetical protein
MGSVQRIVRLVPLGAIAFLVCASPVWANSMAGYMAVAFLANASAMVAFQTLGISLAAIVIIEALVLGFVMKILFARALYVSFMANVLTTGMGMILAIVLQISWSLFPPLIIAVVVGFCIWWGLRARTVPAWVTVMLVLCVPAMLGGSAIFGSPDSQGKLILTYAFLSQALMYLSMMIPQFAVSMAVEGIIASEMLKRRDVWKAVLTGNILSYLLLIALAVVYFPPSTFSGLGASWQSRAKGTLRSLGSSQLAYQNTNDAKVYGSFEALKDEMYIAEGYTQSNMIENYSLLWRVDSRFDEPSETTVSTFTIIALPWDTHPGFLSTFCVTEDQVVRVYNPPGNRFDAYRSWDPIL